MALTWYVLNEAKRLGDLEEGTRGRGSLGVRVGFRVRPAHLGGLEDTPLTASAGSESVGGALRPGRAGTALS